MKRPIATLILLFFLSPGMSLAAEIKGKVLKSRSFDRNTGIVSYELAVPAWVRIRVGIYNGPLHRTIVDWEKRSAGKHSETWDGMDVTGKFSLKGRKDAVYTFDYFTQDDEYLKDFSLAKITPPTDNQVGRNVPALDINRLHKGHPRGSCREGKARLRLPANVTKDKDGFYLITGRTPVSIEIEDGEFWFRRERFSLHVFLDNILIQGELNGYTPYDFIFDPSGINDGDHLLTVNLAGFNDHFAVTGLPLRVAAAKGNKQ